MNDRDLPERLFRERPSVAEYRLDPERRSRGLEDIASFASLAACLMAGASVSASPRRSHRPLPPREHFVPDEPISKRKARRLRGKAKRNPPQGDVDGRAGR